MNGLMITLEELIHTMEIHIRKTGATLFRGICLLAVLSLSHVFTAQAQEGGDDALVITDAKSAQIEMGYSWQGFPRTATSASTSQILVEKFIPREVKPDREYSYEIKVTNQSRYRVDQVVLTERLPNNFVLVRANPAPSDRWERVLQWDLGNLSPRQKEIITITGKAVQPGTLEHNGNSEMNISLGQLTSIIDVIEPLFEFNLEAPPSVIITDPIPVELTFRNAGTAPVRGAQLVHSLPEGLLTSDGSRKIEVYIGDLQPGEAKLIDLELQAQSVGVYETTFVATALDGLTAEATMKVAVQKPKLLVEASAPHMRFVGNTVKYDISVKNVGDAVANETTIEQTVPSGMKFLSANEGGLLKGGIVEWKVGSLQPGETKTVQSSLEGVDKFTAEVSATAYAVAAESESAYVSTDIVGIPALVIRMGDINDPVAVGETETYTIQVENTGSLAATGVVIKCILEDTMEFVSTEGPTPSNVVGKVVTFETLPVLDIGQMEEWRAIVRAKQEGDVRFTVSVECDQLTSPVTENEATNFYR